MNDNLDSKKKQSVYRVTGQDNVATALDDLIPGNTVINGDGDMRNIDCLEPIAFGHKIALCDIEADQPIIKYGVTIGMSVKSIRKGEWVHLHNMKSRYDSRSSTLDIHTGAPSDTQYI